ncbi:MAG TPA: response regulator [Allocoleopsis sp.]
MKKRILLIDDDNVYRLALSEFLELYDFKVFTAANGSIGLALSKALQPDLILCDMNMPGLNGEEVLRELRQNPNTANIPVFILTANFETKTRFRTLAQGANGYLDKTAPLRELIKSIRKLEINFF